MNENLATVFSGSLILFNMMFSDFMHFPTNNMILFFMKNKIPFCRYTTFSFSMQPLIDSWADSTAWLPRVVPQ